MTSDRTGRRLMFLLFLGVVAISSLNLHGQAIIAPGGRTMFHRGTLIRSFLKVEHASLQEEGQSRKVTRYAAPLALVYGFYPQWTLIAIQPYMSLDISSRMGTEVRESNFNGLPDSQFVVQYDGLFSRNSPGGLTRISGVFGIQLPTGAERFSTGAVAYTAGLVLEKAVRLKYVLTSDFQYTLATRNDQGMKMGNRARVDVVPAYFLISEGNAASNSGWWRKLYESLFRHGAYLMLEFNGTWQAHSSDGEIQTADSGGTTFSISPGIQYFPKDRFLVEFSAPIPVIKALNGTQPEPESTFLFGLRFLF